MKLEIVSIGLFLGILTQNNKPRIKKIKEVKKELNEDINNWWKRNDWATSN